jgi:membrane-associated protease RseP (regulator of RpoE activity)
MYWIFWISIMLGLTNALTLFVTDGTPVFKDSLDYVCTRFTKWSQEKRERWTSYITAFLSLLVLFLIFWQLIGPRIA